MLALALVASGCAAQAARPSHLRDAAATTTLLSQGKTATASSLENSSFPASAAVDGNTGTRWSSSFSDPQWLEVDLGASATISQVVLNWETAYATAFQIQTSTDNTNWTTIYSTTTGTGGVQTLNVNGTGRYVRMYGTARATPYGYSLWEFQVYGTSGSTTSCNSTDAALNHPAIASSLESSAYPASNAVDGNTGTRWSSSFSDPQWLQVDLGTSQTICQVTLDWEAAYATAFQIQTSADRHQLDHDLLDHHRHRRHPDPERQRHRPVRPDVRHGPGHPVRLQPVGVRGLHHHRRHHRRWGRRNHRHRRPARVVLG